MFDNIFQLNNLVTQLNNAPFKRSPVTSPADTRGSAVIGDIRVTRLRKRGLYHFLCDYATAFEQDFSQPNQQVRNWNLCGFSKTGSQLIIVMIHGELRLGESVVEKENCLAFCSGFNDCDCWLCDVSCVFFVYK